MSEKRTRGQGGTPLAALVDLSRVLDAQSLAVRMADVWILPANLPGFVEETEKWVSAFSGFIVECLVEHSQVLDLINRSVKAGTETDAGKSASSNVRKKTRKAIVGRDSATDFAAEAEELRKLRAGEVKMRTPRSSKRRQP